MMKFSSACVMEMGVAVKLRIFVSAKVEAVAE